eukprot:3572556-Pyramimonas_sp.AAC.1
MTRGVVRAVSVIEASYMGSERMGSEDRAASPVHRRCIGDASAMHRRCTCDRCPRCIGAVGAAK